MTGKKLDECTVVFNGSGASAIACTRLILELRRARPRARPGDVILCDSKGIVHRDRTDLNAYKAELAQRTNTRQAHGRRSRDAMRGADIFIGLSQANLVDADMVRTMRQHPIIFAMANPIPEIMPDAARAAGAVVVGTGRSDFPNQINNVLAFPGVFRGALDAGAIVINDAMKIARRRRARRLRHRAHARAHPPRSARQARWRTASARPWRSAAARTGVCR